MFNIFQCTNWIARHFGDRSAMAPGLVLQLQVMLHLLHVLWNYCVPVLSALGIPIWYSFLQMWCSFWQTYNRFQSPWIPSVAHAFNMFRSFVKQLKDLDLELSIKKQIILKTCVHLSEKSQVPIWQGEPSSSHSIISPDLRSQFYTCEKYLDFSSFTVINM